MWRGSLGVPDFKLQSESFLQLEICGIRVSNMEARGVKRKPKVFVAFGVTMSARCQRGSWRYFHALVTTSSGHTFLTRQLDYSKRWPRGSEFQVAKRIIFATWNLWHQGEQHGGQRCQKKTKGGISESKERPANVKIEPVEPKFQVAERNLFATWNLSAPGKQNGGQWLQRKPKEPINEPPQNQKSPKIPKL